MTHLLTNWNIMNETILNEVVAAVKARWIAAGRPTGDCTRFAIATQQELARRGVQSDLVAGYAGFSISDVENDVLVWHPQFAKTTFQGGIESHFWVRVQGHIFDTSAMAFNDTLAWMAERDGQHAKAQWQGEFIYTPVKNGRLKFDAFKRGEHAPGNYFYQEVHRAFSVSECSDEQLGWAKDRLAAAEAELSTEDAISALFA